MVATCDYDHGRSSTSIDARFDLVLRAAGIENASIDPASAKYLRDMIALDLEKTEASNKVDQHDASSRGRIFADKPSFQSDEDECGFTPSRPTESKSVQGSTSNIPSPAKIVPLSSLHSDTTKSSETEDGRLSSVVSTAEKLQQPTNDELVSFIDGIEENDTTSLEVDKESVLSDNEQPLVTMLRNELKNQKQVLKTQAKALHQMSDQIRELTETVAILKRSVDTMQSQGSDSPSSNVRTSGNPSLSPPTAEREQSQTPVPGAVEETNANDVADANLNEELRRAHEFSHHIAWRIATFPLRAMWRIVIFPFQAVVFYVKYEYRMHVVLMRLAMRDIIQPRRERGEGGNLFQILFALMIIYVRISPALEKQRRKLEEYNEEENNLSGEDVDFQVHSLALAVIFGFLYHTGLGGLFYRFFIRDRLHVRIWKDLRAGVELTPTYGLDLERNLDAEEENERDENNIVDDDNNQGQQNDDDVNDNDRDGQLAPNGRPRQPNRGGPAADNPIRNAGNAVLHGVNNFFMGHHRRPEQRGAIGGGGAVRADLEEETEVDEVVAVGNPIINLVSDIVCLFYSFFVSILPSWDFEQQLRDIRDEEDRRTRARIQREAEALRAQNDDENTSEEENDSRDQEEESVNDDNI